MANRIESLLMGLGSVDSVSSAWRRHLDGQQESQLAVDSFRRLLIELRSNEGTRQAVAATIAAILNESLSTTGRLFIGKADGQLDVDFITSGNDRLRMASLMAGE